MSKIINILIAIDTDAVKASNPNPSKDSQHPTGIAHTMGYMIGTGTKINSGQGTGDLSISALVGDTVRAFATSGSDNFEDAVLLYGMPKFRGDQVFDDFEYKRFEKSTVVPHSKTQPLPADITDEVFWFFEADVLDIGGAARRDEEHLRPQFLWVLSLGADHQADAVLLDADIF